jgi:hypothetical protein
MGTWDPVDPNSVASSTRVDKDQPTGPEICWNFNTEPHPFGMTAMSEEEKQVREEVNLVDHLLIRYDSYFPHQSIRPSNHSSPMQKKMPA